MDYFFLDFRGGQLRDDVRLASGAACDIVQGALQDGEMFGLGGLGDGVAQPDLQWHGAVHQPLDPIHFVEVRVHLPSGCGKQRQRAAVLGHDAVEQQRPDHRVGEPGLEGGVPHLEDFFRREVRVHA